MAGRSHRIEVIDASELAGVRGGVDRETSALQIALAQATSAVEDVARNVAPKNAGMTDLLLRVMSSRRPGPGPSSAPALPPTSTLTR